MPESRKHTASQPLAKFAPQSLTCYIPTHDRAIAPRRETGWSLAKNHTRRPRATQPRPLVKPLKTSEVDNYIFNEIQLLLAEKRTAFSGLRAGIAVFALPLTVLTFLVATSKLYNFFQVMPFLVIILVLNAGLIVLGTYLVFHAIKRIRHLDTLIRAIKLKHSAIAAYLD
ncbi:MAG: hypothetical protein JWR19_2865 [Pedosphaera sp.]|nr:hypothetical protein [Pedosphaera sp.]